MKEEKNVEKMLGRFLPKPAPSGLKERVIRKAQHEHQLRRIISPALRWALAGCILMLFVFVVADWRISLAERGRLESLLNLPAAEALSQDEAIDEKVAEFLAALPDLNGTLRQIVRRAFLIEERAVRRSERAPQLLMEGINEN